MGQGQSSEGTGAAQAEVEARRDFYELLGVERTASDEEYVGLRSHVYVVAADSDSIKKAYRRKALELHPDRNYGNVESATRLFAEVQSAYEVLSDPQERAWYDSHRDDILRGVDSRDGSGEQYSYNTRMTTTEEIMKLMLRFNARVQFTDSPSGFYGGLRDVFGKLAKEEEIACEWEGLEVLEYPPFGHKDDSFEDVVRPFYAAWNGFATKKTFAWKDVYRLSEAPDRRIRRLMEKENKAHRGEAIQQFNDAVRSLIAFVRKRDPRYQENLQSEVQRQKTLREATAAQAARARAANQAKLNAQVVPDWAKSSAEPEEEISGEESQSEEEHFECVVCNKVFKSEKQFEAHEKSKKHQKNVQGTKRQMQREDQNLNLDGLANGNGHIGDVAGDGKEDAEGDTEEYGSKTAAAKETHHTTAGESEFDDSTANEADLAPETEPTDTQPSSPSDVDEDYATRESIADRLTNITTNTAISELDASLAASSIGTDSDANAKKVGKAKQKRAKKAAQQAVESQSSSDFKCAACRAGFPSKTQLFNHIKELGHAQPVPKAAKGGKKGKR